MDFLAAVIILLALSQASFPFEPFTTEWRIAVFLFSGTIGVCFVALVSWCSHDL